MIQRALLLSLLLTTAGVFGCTAAASSPRASESAFLADFSLGALIEANDRFLITHPTVSSSSVSEPPEPFFQKHEEGVMQVEPGNVAGFMAAISSDIEQALADSGANIVGRGRGGNQGLEGIDLTDIQTFSVRYNAGQTDGVINVWGVHGEGTSFGLIAVITEH